MELLDITKALLDKDGFCRDVNFKSVTWAGVEELLTLFESIYGEISASDMDGKTLLSPFRESVLAVLQKQGQAILCLSSGPGFIKKFQAYICAEDDGAPFVELTFFPDDIIPDSSLRSDFITWADQMQSSLEARGYYARYENASWQFGDIGKHSGVFFVSDDIAYDA